MDDLNQLKTPYFDALKEYGTSEVTPFDIPGHKLGRLNNLLRDTIGEMAFKLDSNSPKGLDNIGKPKGVLKEAQILMAEAFNADRAYFLTGGTSQGILAMILASVGAKEKIIMPRNVHKSVINALVLSGAIPVFLPVQIDKNLGIANGINVNDVRKAIQENPDAKAIFVINPTYFGVASDIKSIVDLAHENNMLVLADEAHGSHLHFHEELPISAMDAGADMSAASIHKTSGSLTQSSVLFAKGSRVNYNRVRLSLNILQSTSPSGLLLASLDVARQFIYFNGHKLLEDTLQVAYYAYEQLSNIPGIEVITRDDFINAGCFDFDETKLLINIRDLGKPGYFFYNYFKDRFNIQIELAETYVILLVLTIGSTKKDIDILKKALVTLSNEMYTGKHLPVYEKFKYSYPESYVRPRSAFHAPKKFVSLRNSLGEISGESIMIYPPGIPLVIPGEIINEDIIEMLEFYESNGFNILTDQDDDSVKIIDKDNWIKWSEDDDL